MQVSHDKASDKPSQNVSLWLCLVVSICIAVACEYVNFASNVPFEIRVITYRFGIGGAILAVSWSVWTIFALRRKQVEERRYRVAAISTALGCAGLLNSFIGLNAMAFNLTSPVVNFVVQSSGVFTYVVWPVALFMLPSRRATQKRRLPWLLDVGLIITAITAAGWFFLVAPQVDTTGNANAVWLRLIFPVVDLISFAVVVAAISLGGPFVSARGVLMLAILVNAGGDVVQCIDIIRHRSTSGNLADTMWVVAVLLGGLAALLIKSEADHKHLKLSGSIRINTPDWVAAIIPAAFLSALVGLAVWGNWSRPHSIDAIGLNIGCIAELAMGLVRLVQLIKENNDLATSMSRMNKSLDGEVQSRTRELSDARDELDQQRTFLRSVIDALPNLVFATKPDGTVTLANEAAARFTGHSVLNLQFSNYADVIGGINPNAPNIIAAESERLLRGEKLEIAEREIVDSTHSTHTFEVVKTPIIGRDGSPDQILIIANDITVRKEAELSLIASRDAAERSTKVKSEFLANMSHEIRTPMNGVLGCAELLLNESLPDQHREYVSAIKSSGEQLLGVINDILDLSKLEAGQVDVQLEPTVLGDVCREIVDRHRSSASAKGISIRLEFMMDPQMRLITDQNRLRQVLNHLISNAIKFTESGSVIVEVSRTRTSSNLQTILFSVADTGIGIAGEQLTKVFEPFYQADSANSRRYGGTGLGLSLCRQFVRLLGGQINVSSALGEGSKFAFELTCQLAADEPVAVESMQQDLVGLHVLLVEDNIVNQKVAKKLLERLGCSVHVANNGLEAVEWLLEQRCDVVLMDCQMPVMDGLEATRRIRTFAKPGAEVPIIAVTANAMAGDREMCIAAGMDDYVPKPIRAEQLAGAIGRLANRRAAA